MPGESGASVFVTRHRQIDRLHVNHRHKRRAAGKTLVKPTSTGTPFVIDAPTDSPVSLDHFLATRPVDVESRIAEHGAVLFRNFEICTESAFEKAVLSIDGMRGMTGYFMSEP